MKRHIQLIISIFVITNLIYSQDIINETGKDGKFIVRDAEQQEALIVEDGNVAITGGLKIETMPEGKSTDDMVVWDKNNKSLKVVPRVFSKVSPLSEPLDTRSWHSLGYGEVDEFGNEISASVQGVEAVSWNSFFTDYGFIKLGPANTFYAHIFTDRTRFLFNKPVTFLDAKFGSAAGQDFHIETGGIARLAIDAPTGNVGIGTTTPAQKLDVAGTAQMTGFKMATGVVDGHVLTTDGSGVGSWQTPQSADNLGNHTATQDINLGGFELKLLGGWISGDGDEEGIYVDSDGHVGIGGTTNPFPLLSVGGNGYADVSIFGLASATSGYGVYGRAAGTTGRGVYENAASGSGVNYGVFGSTSSTDGYAGYFIGRGFFSENVGIGTTDPRYKMHLHESTSGYAYLDFTNGTTGSAGTDGVLIGLDPNENFRVHSYENNDLTFWTNNDEKFRIASTGNVGIGTTSPGHLLHVDGEMEVDGAIYADDATGVGFRDDGGNLGLWVKDGGNVGIGTTDPSHEFEIFGNTQATGEYLVHVHNNATAGSAVNISVEGSGYLQSYNKLIRFQRQEIFELGSIDCNGSSDNVRYNTSSDARLKNDLGGEIEGLETVSQIKVRKYEFKTSPGYENIGFFAQELQNVYPDAVSGSPDGDVTTDPMGIDYGRLTPILVKAIQELQARIEELENN